MSLRGKPTLLIVLAALLLLEALALAGTTIYLGVEIVVSPSKSITSAIALTVVFGLVAVALGVVGVSTLRARPWIRGAAICWQALQILLAWSILQAGAPGIAALLAVPAVIIVVLIFVPSVAHTLSRED